MTEKINSAQCYESQAWQSYQLGKISEFESSRMEEHLLICENCLEIYLGIIEKSLLEDNAPKLEEGFNDKVLKVIEEERCKPKASARVVNINQREDREVRNSKVNLLISYCAAACIVMFFWIGGYFDGLSGTLSKGVEHLHPTEALEEVQPPRGLIRTGWTQKVISEERSSFIKNFIPKKE
jgi:hypothetical protein